MEINTAIVAGTGKSGISATKLLVNHGVKVYLFDENKDRDIEAIKEKTGDSELVQIELRAVRQSQTGAAEAAARGYRQAIPLLRRWWPL